MKTRIIFTLIALLMWPGSVLRSQQQPEQLNLPGDNLNLYAVMKIFQESETLEIFEKRLNEEDARVNNLDLNWDNYIDYIKVVDYVERNVHYIVLQVAVTPTENQDVAVFVVKKDPDGQVVIQLIGDEALYGKFYIVEPYYNTSKGDTPNPGYYGNYNTTQTIVVHQTTTYEVASWPLIRYIYLPTYVVWSSPWYWGYYPSYWRPWTPWFWHQYYGYHYHWNHHYYAYYHHGNHYRHDNWDNYYYGNRHASSNSVKLRKERGDYKPAYSKPESIREGTAYFRKMHPEAVRPDMKEPEVKDIRSTARYDEKPGKAGGVEKPDNKMNENSSVDKTKATKTDSKSMDIKSSKTENKSGQVKESRPEIKSGGTTPDKSRIIKKEDRKSPAKPPAKETKSQSREKAKKDNAKPSKESAKPDGK